MKPTFDFGIILGKGEWTPVVDYHVKRSVLTQPGAFAVTLGLGDKLTAEVLKKYPPGTPFQLFVRNSSGGQALVMTGRVDAMQANATPYGTSIVVRGRDPVALLHDAYIASERSWTDGTILDIVNAAMKACKAGELRVIDDVAEVRWPIEKAVQAKLGMRWFDDVVKPQLDRAGLVLSANPRGQIILWRPSAAPEPKAQIRHNSKGTGNVERAELVDDSTHRFTKCVVYGRRGGGAEAITKVSGEDRDRDLEALGFDRPLLVHAPKCTSIRAAQFLARRHLVQSRREGFSLSYTIAGCLLDGVLVQPGDTVTVDDEVFAQAGKFFVEGVELSSRPAAETTFTLMRRTDVLFASEAAPAATRSGYAGD